MKFHKVRTLKKVFFFQTGVKQRQNGVAISPTVQQNDELAGSFKNSVNRSVSLYLCICICIFVFVYSPTKREKFSEQVCGARVPKIPDYQVRIQFGNQISNFKTEMETWVTQSTANQLRKQTKTCKQVKSFIYL